ncbi:dTDP-4-amino-4,6-dideoxygalactose transaminase [Scopulibacillus darangshiensis]|uniref:dTDP-4-amino-4,6-dideoxygalactose transaminase n=1 Tax=Scopulibacillus darangshiensis TaxID=442528 RepID=A0A4R2NFB2_9BACL|nr:dTDP-4-amino-4,6-dideoxygalactose transaminase [Scopulibacillus darangshiensis]TCP19973.1 dTDP-4-amino-4,6-dideoxygalactose transaminase [Scopulibacillus darangshiensis]
MIPFNQPALAGNEEIYLQEVLRKRKLSGEGDFTIKCHRWIEQKFNCEQALLTPSCTHALEMSAVLMGIKPGDEVIMPSYTFSSTANAFALHGAKIVFVDIKPDTMNIDERMIEAAVTKKTKAIVVVHYAGVACEMDAIQAIADRCGLFIVEDAAQGVMSTYKGKPLGTIGTFGCFSFHETKNYTSGEGGALLINDKRFASRAEIIREKGTNRKQFLRGQVDKYSWVDIGSSYLPSELNAAYLYAQFEKADHINQDRLASWEHYYHELQELADRGYLDLPHIPDFAEHNAHMFYIKAKDIRERTKLISFLKENDIMAVFHYIPLHSSNAGKMAGAFHGEETYTTKESERLLRLPMYYGLKKEEIGHIAATIKAFYL